MTASSDLGSLDIQEIREEAEYPGRRVRVNISIGTFSGKVLWDISTGDPIVPTPKMVKDGAPVDVGGARRR